MSLPINNSTTISSLSNISVQKKDEEVKDTEGYQSSDSSVEETPQKSKSEALQSKFHFLMLEYQCLIPFTAGGGSSGQIYIDAAWKRLENFVNDHPEFAKEMPKSKHISRNDGTGGIATCLGIFADANSKW